VKRGVLVGSIAVHAGIAALLYGIAGRAPAPPARGAIDIELVPAARASERAAAGAAAVGSDAGGAARAAVRAAALGGAAPASAPRTPSRGGAPDRAPARARLAITGYDRGGPASGAVEVGSGEGGPGAGTGAGTVLGAGAGLGTLPALPLPPVPAPAPAAAIERPSRARPPRLVYPARDREGEEADMFVARLTVDSEGYVVGARLIRGALRPRGELASQLVWRFRYAPALDDDGRAIRATIDQRFLVGN
jgi:hypothetical protein